MNRREFLKKSLELVVLASIPLIYNCSKNPVDPKGELEGTYIDKELLADGFGDHNGVALKTELDDMYKYYKSDPEAWGFNGFPETYCNKNEIPLSELINNTPWGFVGPFKNEAELRKYVEGSFALWPSWLGIYVFDSGDYKSEQYRLKYFYKCYKWGEFMPMIVNKE